MFGDLGLLSQQSSEELAFELASKLLAGLISRNPPCGSKSACDGFSVSGLPRKSATQMGPEVGQLYEDEILQTWFGGAFGIILQHRTLRKLSC